MGCRTLLVTHSIDTIGVMSCNPAIGGLGKTHLVKEVDALDGLMGKAADMALFTKECLIQAKGPFAIRVQACRDLYAEHANKLKQLKTLASFEQKWLTCLLKTIWLRALIQKSRFAFSKAVVLTTGTFLAGKSISVKTPPLEAVQVTKHPIC